MSIFVTSIFFITGRNGYMFKIFKLNNFTLKLMWIGFMILSQESISEIEKDTFQFRFRKYTLSNVIWVAQNYIPTLIKTSGVSALYRRNAILFKCLKDLTVILLIVLYRQTHLSRENCCINWNFSVFRTHYAEIPSLASIWHVQTGFGRIPRYDISAEKTASTICSTISGKARVKLRRLGKMIKKKKKKKFMEINLFINRQANFLGC